MFLLGGYYWENMIGYGLGLYWGYIGIMKKKMETSVLWGKVRVILVLSREWRKLKLLQGLGFTV